MGDFRISDILLHVIGAAVVGGAVMLWELSGAVERQESEINALQNRILQESEKQERYAENRIFKFIEIEGRLATLEERSKACIIKE